MATFRVVAKCSSSGSARDDEIISRRIMSTSSASATTTEHAALEGIELTLSLTVKDLEKSVAWYEGVIGFSIADKYEREGTLRAVAMRSGSVRILLNVDDGGRGWDRVKGEGFAFQITTAQNLDELAKGIKARGGSLATEPADMPWGARIFRLVDPDGFRWSVSSPRAG
jgi:lactoylglutathione lyase